MSAGATPSEIASRLNLKKYVRSWRGTCPACDYARVFSLKAGRGDRHVIYCANGCSQDTLAETMSRRLGEDWKPSASKEGAAENEAVLREQKSKQAVAVFNGSTVITPTDPAAKYLGRRHLQHLVTSPALRFRGDCYHPEGGRYPALIALVQDCAGRAVACHRTYLRADGSKAAVEPPKASKGPVWKSAIRLHPAAAEIVVGEGLETSASAGLLLGLPAWAAINAGNLARALALPPEVRAVTIAADRDEVGARAANEAAARWRAEGRRVRIAWPDVDGQDFNDVLTARMEAQSHAA